MTLDGVLAGWEGEGTMISRDVESGAWIVIALHSTHLGPAGGGTRMREYADLAEAVVDAQRLATSMTYKFAVAGFPMGGGKAVLAVPRGLGVEARRDLLRRYGARVKSLRGAFFTGPDVGTSPADMDVVGETGAPYVFARTRSGGGCGGSSPPTARGVHEGIAATLRGLDGDASLDGRRIAVQGVGSVGQLLVKSLLEAGARVVASDASAAVREGLRGAGAVEVVGIEEIYDVPCDVFAPCAMGGVLNSETIPRLRCRAVAGAANNQLLEAVDGDRLRQRGILYAPDFVISAGGALYVVGIEALGWSEERAADAVRGIGDTLLDIYRRAADEEVSTERAARRLAESRLAQSPAPAA